MTSDRGQDAFAEQGWVRKFKVAFRGIGVGVRDQKSFRVHLPTGVAVLSLSAWLGIEVWQWCVLIGCIGLVLTLELLNTALESLSRAITREHNEWIRDALDLASGAVLIGSLTSLAVGGLVLGPEIAKRFFG